MENAPSCRFIDGTGSTPQHAGAANLTAGTTYRVHVTSPGSAQNYALVLILR